MARYVDDSLKKLDTDHVDVFLLHGVTPSQYPHARDVMVPELKRQQAAGKVRFLAISEQFGGDTGHAMFRDGLADDLFDVVMVGFNILNPSARQRVFPQTREKDVGTLIMFAVREALSRPDELKKVVGRADRARRGRCGRGGRGRSARLPRRRPRRGRGRLPLLPPRTGRRRHPDRHRRSGAPEGQRGRRSSSRRCRPRCCRSSTPSSVRWTASRATETAFPGGAEKRRRSPYIGRRTRVGERRSLLTGCCQSRA